MNNEDKNINERCMNSINKLKNEVDDLSYKQKKVICDTIEKILNCKVSEKDTSDENITKEDLRIYSLGYIITQILGYKPTDYSYRG